MYILKWCDLGFFKTAQTKHTDYLTKRITIGSSLVLWCVYAGTQRSQQSSKCNFSPEDIVAGYILSYVESQPLHKTICAIYILNIRY